MNVLIFSLDSDSDNIILVRMNQMGALGTMLMHGLNQATHQAIKHSVNWCYKVVLIRGFGPKNSLKSQTI